MVQGLLLSALLVAAPPDAGRDAREDGWGISETVDDAMARAREQMQRAREQMREALREAHASRHRRMGVVVRGAKDGHGLLVDAVTPGGAAAKAGLQAGDVLTRAGGASLEGASPGRLSELVRSTKPGGTLKVEYLRGGKNGAVDVLIPEHDGWDGVVELPQLPELPEISFRHLSSRWGGLDLVALNPELGEYFGAQKGILVVQAPGDGSLALKAGDVILKVGEREAASPGQVVRILRSYDPGEVLRVEVMRHKGRQTLEVKVP